MSDPSGWILGNPPPIQAAVKQRFVPKAYLRELVHIVALSLILLLGPLSSCNTLIKTFLR